MSNKISLLNDLALGDGDDTLTDGLGFEAYASVLSEVARGTAGPFTIGVFGEWGTGKTSLMRLIQDKLKGDDNVATVWFNAWQYEKEEHPLVPLVATIVYALEQEKGIFQKMGDMGSSFVKTLRSLAYGFSLKAKAQVPALAEIEMSMSAKDAIEKYDKLMSDSLLSQSVYHQIFERFSALKLPHDFRIVVFIDDLDRCFPDSAIKLLESIKLVLSQAGFIFVVSVARQVIEGYLTHRYNEQYGIRDFKGSMYLDKIVQLPFEIPPNEGKMEALTRVILPRLGKDGDMLRSILPLIGEAMGGNPRALLRFVNGLIVDVNILNNLNFGFDAKITIGVLSVSKCLQHFWPSFFSLAVQNPQVADSLSELAGYSAALKKIIETDDGAKAKFAKHLLSDRLLRGLMVSEPGRSWFENSKVREYIVRFTGSLYFSSEKRSKFDLIVCCAENERSLAVCAVEDLNLYGLRVDLKEIKYPLDGRFWEELLLDNDVSVGLCAGATANCASVDDFLQSISRRELKAFIIKFNDEDVDDPIESFLLDLRKGVTLEAVKQLREYLPRLRL